MSLSAEFTRTMQLHLRPMMSHRDGAVSGGATAFGYRPAVSTRWGVCVTL